MNYWERRQAEDAYEAFEDAEKTAKVIARYYAGASSFLIRKAERVFEKFRQKHHLTEAEAKALLSKVRDKKSAAELLERLRASVNRQEKEELLSEIEAPAYRARLMRLAELQDNTDRVLQALYTKENNTSTEFYKQLAEESYLKEIYRTQQRANAAFSFGSVDKKTVDRVLRSKWSGKNYSERIWDNTQELADTLKDEMILSFLTGKGERDMARSIQDRFRVGANAARRLVRTESNHIRTEMDFEAYKEAGVEEYQYLATLDLRTSKVCRSLDGKIFKVSDRKVGVNCPPMHPWCRSTTISVIDRDLLDTMQRVAIDPATGERIMVPRTMTYQEWYEKYASGHMMVAIQGDNPHTAFKDLKEAYEFLKRNVLSNNSKMQRSQGVPVKELTKVINRIAELQSKYDLEPLSEFRIVPYNKTWWAKSNGNQLDITKAFLQDPKSKVGDMSYNWRSSHLQQLDGLNEWYKSISNPSPKDTETYKNLVKHIQDDLQYSRYNVVYKGKEVESVITHEFGHIIADQYFGQVTSGAFINKNHRKSTSAADRLLTIQNIDKIYSMAVANGDIYNISKYASTNAHEFFADCFTIYEMGKEELPKYIREMVENALK